MKRLVLLALFAGMTVWAQESNGEADSVSGWRWANFVLLAVVLGFLVRKHIPPAFRARSSEIQKGIAEAQALKAGAEKRAAQIDARMKSLGTEIETLRTQSKAEMQMEGERIQRETVAVLKKLEDQAALEIESAGKLAQRELKQFAAGLALDLAERRIRARMDGSTEAALVDRFARDLNTQGAKN